MGVWKPGWKVTQALEGQAPKVWTDAHLHSRASQKAPRGSTVLGDKAQAWKQKTWTGVCAPPLTHPPPAKWRRRGGGRGQLPRGASQPGKWNAPPIRKGLGGALCTVNARRAGAGSQKRAPEPSACSKICPCRFPVPLPRRQCGPQ